MELVTFSTRHKVTRAGMPLPDAELPSRHYVSLEIMPTRQAQGHIRWLHARYHVVELLDSDRGKANARRNADSVNR